jgi:23S rRNA (cytosine1962-C5)-methyltransferase
VRTIRLKKNEDRRIRAGHLWIFSNEIANLDQHFAPGETVDILTYGGGFAGRGYMNPRSLIAVRVLTRNKEPIEKEFFARRISDALALRRRLFPGEQSYRIVCGEADGLPGLIIDKYSDVIVLRVSTLGMHMRLGEILGALSATEIASPSLILRTDASMAELEGFTGEDRVLTGNPALPVRIEQDGLFFDVDVLEGQKTGFYLDQRENRRSICGLLRGQRVLDCFCYTGAWSLYAGKSGANEVVGIDSSASAIEMARRNADINLLGSTCRFETADEQAPPQTGRGRI